MLLVPVLLFTIWNKGLFIFPIYMGLSYPHSRKTQILKARYKSLLQMVERNVSNEEHISLMFSVYRLSFSIVTFCTELCCAQDRSFQAYREM